MVIYLCGKGKAAEEILRQMLEFRHKVVVFSHSGAPILNVANELGVLSTVENINKMDLWPYHMPPGMLVSVGYLHIIKPPTLAAVNRAINCHYALLPNHRGRSAVPWTILDGDRIAGITWHWIDEGIDTGRILVQGTCHVRRDETATSLFEKLHGLAVDYWPAAFHLAGAGWPGVEQVDYFTQYHRAGPPYDGEIDPAWDDGYVDRYIRAMTFPPLPYARLAGQEVASWDDFERIRDVMLRGYAV